MEEFNGFENCWMKAEEKNWSERDEEGKWSDVRERRVDMNDWKRWVLLKIEIL